MKKAVCMICASIAICWSGVKGGTHEAMWIDTPVSIDGNADEWSAWLTYFEKHNMSVGVVRDSSYLYVCLLTNDVSLQRKILGMGLNVWVNGRGKKKKEFGVGYPVGRMQSGQSMGARPQPMPENMGQNQGVDFASELYHEFDLLGKKEADKHRIPLAQADGIEVCIDMNNSVLTYELRISLDPETHAMAVSLEENKKLYMGFMTNEIDREEMQSRMQQGMNRSGGGGERMGGGMSGGMGGRSGGRGQRQGGMGGRPGSGSGSDRPGLDPLDLWAKFEFIAE